MQFPLVTFFYYLFLARGQLASTMNGGLLGGPDARGLATDGFLSNLTAAIVRLTGPLIHPPTSGPPLNKLWPAFASQNSPEKSAFLLGLFQSVV